MSKKCDINSLIKVLQKHTEITVTSDEYILADNWNDVPHALMDYTNSHWDTDYKENAVECSQCGCYIRISATCQSWEPDFYAFQDGDYLCEKDALEQADSIIEELVFYADSLPVYPGACFGWFKEPLEKAGFAAFNSEHSLCKDIFNAGIHYGQTDSPSKVAQLISETLGATTEVIFMVDRSTPFDIGFSAYVRVPKPLEKLTLR